MPASRLVYSTGGDNSCPQCGKLLHKCRCGSSHALPAIDGTIRISRTSKGRAGKTVTLISGVSQEQQELKRTWQALKSLCGAGGSIKQGNIEIQGDHRQAIADYFTAQGRQVKLAGG